MNKINWDVVILVLLDLTFWFLIILWIVEVFKNN